MNNRLERCDVSRSDNLIEYLKQEAVRNTFLIGDIINYGFENEIQEVWADIDGKAIEAVYIWFCNNLLIYSHKDILEQESLSRVLEIRHPDQVMAKRSHLQQIQTMLNGYTIKSKSLLGYEQTANQVESLSNSSVYTYRIGTSADVESIYAFLQSGELAPLYRSKEMIAKRIETGEGVHLLMEEDGELVAQINSAAATPYSAMIGGLFTKDEYRGAGRARYLVDNLCRILVNNGLVPCLISALGETENLFLAEGFREIEEFTTLEPN